jgi:hypothetical protein
MRYFAAVVGSVIMAGCSSASIPAGPSVAGSTGVVAQSARGTRGVSGFYVVPFQSQGAGEVTLYPGTLTPPSKTLYQFGSPNGLVHSLATDSAQNVYLANAFHAKEIDEYSPLTDVPQAVWECANYPYSLAIENNLIYVLEDSGGSDAVSLEIFEYGKSKPLGHYTIAGASGAGQVAADNAGDVFATAGGGVFDLPHGSSSFSRLFDIYAPTTVAVDTSGNLVLQYLGRRNITHTEIYPPGSSTPMKSFRNLPHFTQLSFSHDGKRLYAGEEFPYESGFAFYHYPSFKTIYSYTGSGWTGVSAIAASPPAPVGTW